MIDIKDVTLAYSAAPKKQILHNITFQIPRAACVALIGKSGSGKSTLAKVISGHLIPQSGSILFSGRDMTGKPGKHALLVHQESDLFPWQTAERHLWMALRRKDKEISDHLLDLVGLLAFASYYPSQLSGGMQKRLALARGVALSPDLIILDETFSSLDKETKENLIYDLETLWKETRTTTLMITHDPNDVARLATGVINLPQ